MVSFRSGVAKSVIQKLSGGFPGRVWSFVALAFLLLFAIPATASDKLSVLNSWLAAQTNLHTWSADFIQTRRLKALAQPLTNSGHLWFQAPDRFRWELGQPAQTIALRQPDLLLVIYPNLKRIERYPLRDHQARPWRDALTLLEAGFPRSQAELESRFRILSLTSTNRFYELNLQPKSASARRLMRQIKISFGANDFVLRSTELVFSDDSTLRNDFSNALANQSINSTLFQFSPSPDYEIVEPARR